MNHPHSYIPGTKVICLFDAVHRKARRYFRSLPREGEIYTISHVYTGCEHLTGRPVLSLHLSEIQFSTQARPGLCAWRFQPLVPPRQPAKTAAARQTRYPAIRRAVPV